MLFSTKFHTISIVKIWKKISSVIPKKFSFLGGLYSIETRFTGLKCNCMRKQEYVLLEKTRSVLWNQITSTFLTCYGGEDTAEFELRICQWKGRKRSYLELLNRKSGTCKWVWGLVYFRASGPWFLAFLDKQDFIYRVSQKTRKLAIEITYC